MPLLRAVPVLLSAGERTTLNKRVRGAKTTWRDRLRAQIVLAAARGHPNARIAAGLGISAGTVRKWRARQARPQRARVQAQRLPRAAGGPGEIGRASCRERV